MYFTLIFVSQIVLYFLYPNSLLAGNILTPKCDPILVTLLKMQPHYSQSSRENATPPSGVSPLACYQEVSPPPPVNKVFGAWIFDIANIYTSKISQARLVGQVGQ